MVLILAYAGVQSHGFLDYMIIVFARVLTFTLWHFRCFRFMCLFVVSGFASFIGFPPKAAKQGTLWEAASNTIPLGIVFFGGRLAASAVTPHGRASTVSRRSLGHKRWAGCRPPFWQHLLLGVGGQRGWGCATVLSYYIQW